MGYKITYENDKEVNFRGSSLHEDLIKEDLLQALRNKIILKIN